MRPTKASAPPEAGTKFNEDIYIPRPDGCADWGGVEGAVTNEEMQVGALCRVATALQDDGGDDGAGDISIWNITDEAVMSMARTSSAELWKLAVDIGAWG